MEKTNKLISGNLWKETFFFALPFLFANFLQSFYGAVDLAVVGQVVGTTAVSAVANGSLVMMTATFLVTGFSVGATVLIGKAIGNNDQESASKVIENTIFLSIFLAIVLTPLMIFLSEPLVEIMQTPADAVEQAKAYVLVCSFGVPGIVGFNMTAAIIRGTGDSKTPLLFVFVACLINIALDILFVKTLNMDTVGAALATTISQFASFVFGLIYMSIKKGLVKISFKNCFKPSKDVCSDVLYIGGPLAIQDVIIHLSFILIAAIINRLGLVASSAIGVSDKIFGLVFIIPSSYAQASAVICSQNIGAREVRRAYKSIKVAMVISLAVTAFASLFIVIFPEFFIRMFDDNPEVVSAASSYMRSYVIDALLVCILFNYNSYLSSYKKSGLIFTHSVAATFLLRAPLAYLLSSLTTDLFIIGLASPITTLFQVIFVFFIVTNLAKKKLSHSTK